MSDDYRQPSDMGGTRPVTLVCRENVPPDSLSTWRDGLLPPDQAAWLERHAPTCPACSERLRDYVAAGSALAGQIIPRPGNDLWPGVRAAIERETRGATRQGMRLPRGLALGGIGAGVAALLLVALFAGLLFSHKSGRPTLASTPTASQTATSAATATSTTAPSVPGVWTTLSGCPATTPARFRVLYQAGIAQQKSAPTIVTLQRSDDCGATWTQLTPPQISGVSYTSNVDLMNVFANPLNPQIAYLTLQFSDAGGCSASGASSARLALSGGACQPQFVTTDGGATWNRLSLPVSGVLGEASASGFVTIQAQGALRAQGSLLYGVVTNAILGSSGVIPPGRLLVSGDGVHWSVADSALAAQGYGVWDFAVTPSGSTIYATEQPFNDPNYQPPIYTPTLSIWRSADGGQTWTESAHGPDGSYGQGGSVMFMSAGLNGSQPILYAFVEQKGATQMLASLDGGRNWTIDTQFPDNRYSNNMYELLGALPDGSVVMEQSAGGGATLAWKPGTKQRDVAQNAGLQNFGGAVLQQTANGEYLWLTGAIDSNGDTAVRYVQLKL